MLDEEQHPLGDEDRIRATCSRLSMEVQRRLWAAYDGWAWAPETERAWARTMVKGH